MNKTNQITTKCIEFMSVQLGQYITSSSKKSFDKIHPPPFKPHDVRKKKKRNMKTIQKFNRIKEILFEFDKFSPDQQISSLCATLERLGFL